MAIKLEPNQRGFVTGNFKDRYNEDCSIQKSSAATEDCIWLGINNPKLTVFADKTKGNYLITDMPENFSVSSRMHLTREQVGDLLPLLQNFVNTGDLYS